MIIVAHPDAPPLHTARTRHGRLAFGLLLAIALLGLVLLLSLAVGKRPVPLGAVFDALWHYRGSADQVAVRGLRGPRTLLGLLAGTALGTAGALMQALTRNPLADPGILGVNAGASVAVVLSMALLGLTSATQYIWFAFVGAAVVSIAVYLLGSRGSSGATPVRLALAGTAITAALTSLVQFVLLSDADVFGSFRFWRVGSLLGRQWDVILQLAPFVLAGLVLALALARPLNVLALGEETGRALGVRPARTRVLGAVAVTVLCGAATAMAGPIAFVGLAVPHIARAVTGPDQRWLMPYSMVLSPVLLIGADILGRIALPDGELEVGLVTAMLGAPVFIALARRRRIAQL